MDSTLLPYLTEDELTYELKVRGLPDVGTMAEKRNILEGILASSLTTTFPVHKPRREDDQVEHSVCQQKLQEMSGTILALINSSHSDYGRFYARLNYLKERVMRITSPELRNRLLLVWAQLLGDFNSKKSMLLNRSGDLLSLNPEVPAAVPPAESTHNETSFLDRVNQLSLSGSQTHGTPSRVHSLPFVPPVFSPVQPRPTAPDCVDRVLTTAEPVPIAHKYAQLSKWNIFFDGSGSVNDFLEQTEEMARARGVSHDQLFQQSSELFRGQALIWHRHARSEVSSWPELVSRLRTAFLPSDYEFELWDEIRARTQGPTERTEIFVAVMQSLFGRFSYAIDEHTRLQMIIRNLQPKFQTEISVSQSQTIRQLLVICKHMEDAAHRAAKFKNPPARSQSLLEPELAYRRERTTIHHSETFSTSVCWNCNKSGHRAVSCPEPQTKHCYSCGQKGVTKFTCRQCSSRVSKNVRNAPSTSTDGREPTH